MDPNELLEVLEPLFDAYQHSSTGRRNSALIQSHVADVYHATRKFRANWQAKEGKQDVDEGEGEVEDSVEEWLTCLSEVLVHFFDCAISMEYTASSKHAVGAIFELVAAVASHHLVLVEEVLDRAIECSRVLLERVRASACQFIGNQVSYILTSNRLSSEERDQLLDQASQALIPRITDKAQSVRLAFNHAAGSFFSKMTEEGNETVPNEEDDPELREGLQWSLQHDPSVTNRIAALEALPVTVQTSDLVISRLRDVKPKVRCAAADLVGSLSIATQLDADQCAAVVEAGSTSRCEAIKDILVDLICSGWMRDFEFDPIRLLKKIDVVEHEESCEKLIRILLNVDRQHLSTMLTKTEFQRYWDELNSAGAGLLTQKGEIDLARLFYIRVRCQNLTVDSNHNEAVEKEAILAAILPDVPTLCEKFELHAMALMKLMIDREQTIITQNDEEMTCVCLNLLQLFDYVSLEEGSRLHLKTTMKRMLGSVLTPDDLVEGCVKALRNVVGNREDLFWDEALDVVHDLDLKNRESESTVEGAYVLRILTIISVVCEISSSQLSQASDVQRRFYSMVAPGISHDNTLVRQAAVGCLGRLGMFVGSVLFAEKLGISMVELAANELEPMEVRVQALFALTDWTLLGVSPESKILESLLQLVPELLEDTETKVVCAVAEIALRLLFSMKVLDSEWIAKLVFLFFDSRLSSPPDQIEEESQAMSEIGNPERLQQLLSLFFPGFCIQNVDAWDAFVGCVSTLLQLCMEKDNQKRKRGTKTIPVAKVIDYVLVTANNAFDFRNSEESDGHADGQSGQTFVRHVTPSLVIALQLAQFIIQKQDDCSISLLRTLCKHLGKTVIDLEIEKSWQHLSHLAELLEQLGTELTDDTCLEYIQDLIDVLSNLDIPVENDNTNIADVAKRLSVSTDDGKGIQKHNHAAMGDETIADIAEKENQDNLVPPSSNNSKSKTGRSNELQTPLKCLS
ncbi:hypothetical protein ACA910_015467 [Epithemia clementina (nom. ined.)]